MSSPFSFSIASSSDVPEMLEFLLTDFLFSVPLNLAVGMTREDAYDRYLASVEVSVANGTSAVVRNEDGVVIGVRLSGFEDRDKPIFPTNISSLGLKPRTIARLLNKINYGRWDLIPSDIHRVFEVRVVSVAKKYRGRGIAKDLLSFELDAVRENGARGAVADLVAIASQGLFSVDGYSVLREIVYEDYLDEEGKPVFVCPDGSKKVQLV
ncbi:hypothetical protein PMAYCL1PPCAC_01721, partial [Pristionchus mayeri]